MELKLVFCIFGCEIAVTLFALNARRVIVLAPSAQPIQPEADLKKK